MTNNNQQQIQYTTAWNKDEAIMEMVFESIKDAQVTSINQNYPVSVALYSNVFNILFQQIENLYGHLDESAEEVVFAKELNERFKGIIKTVHENMTVFRSTSIKNQREESNRRGEIVLANINQLNAIIWESVNHAQMFLQVKKKYNGIDAIKRAM